MCDNNSIWLVKLLLLGLLMQHVVCVAYANVHAAVDVNLSDKHNNNVGGGSGGIVDGIDENVQNADDGLLFAEQQTQQRQKPDNHDANSVVDLNAYANEFNMQDETSIPEDIYDQKNSQNDITGNAAAALDAFDFQYDETEGADIILESQGPTSKNFTMFFLNNSNKKQNENFNSQQNQLKQKKAKAATKTKIEKHTDTATDTETTLTSDNSEYQKLKNSHGATEHDNANQHLARIVLRRQNVQKLHKLKAATTNLNNFKYYNNNNNEEEDDAVAVAVAAGNVDDGDNASQAFENYNYDNQQYSSIDNNNNNNNNYQYYNTPIGDISEEVAAVNKFNIPSAAVNVDETIAATKSSMNIGNKLTERKLKRHSRGGDAAVVITDADAAADVYAVPGSDGVLKNFNSANYGQQFSQKEEPLTDDNDDDDDDDGDGDGDHLKTNEDADADADADTMPTHMNNAMLPTQQQQQQRQAKYHHTQAHNQIKIPTTKLNTYFGILTNGSTTLEHTHNAERLVNTATGADGAVTQLIQADIRATDDDTDNVAKNNDAHDDDDDDDDDEADDDDAVIRVYEIGGRNKKKDINRQQQQQQQQTLTKAATQSAFEQSKALRRNNKRNGHKSYKKKYKDYLRYVVVTATPTTTTTTPTTTTTLMPTNDNQYNNQYISKENTADSFNATKAKPDSYQQQQQQQQHQIQRDSQQTSKKLTVKLEAEKSHGLPASPIFTVNGSSRKNNRKSNNKENRKAYYEGQVNYYVDTKDATVNDAGTRKTGERNDDNWYRHVSPMLRNGMKATTMTDADGDSEHVVLQHRQQQQHHHHRQHHHQQQHHRHRQHHNKHHQSTRHNSYQRRLHKPASKPARPLIPTLPPIPPPSYKQHQSQSQSDAVHELGHQITELEELERYYAKWPHLARVQFQVYDEHFRETHPELYPDYEYESVAALEAAQNENSEEAKLPPYIKKFNRRNKQLLDLLEGTIAPATKSSPLQRSWSSSLLQPGPHESSAAAAVVHIDDDYMKQKRRRYQLRNAAKGNANLFAQQQQQPAIEGSSLAATQQPQQAPQNKIPEEDLSLSQEEPQQHEHQQQQQQQRKQSHEADYNWQREIESKSNSNAELTGNSQMTWQIDKLTATATVAPAAIATATTTAPKSALFRLPSYTAFAGGNYIVKTRNRSAQFAPSSGLLRAVYTNNDYNNNNNNNKNYIDDYINNNINNKSSLIKQFNADNANAAGSSGSSQSTATVSAQQQPKSVNSFVYHRVVDASSPRLVGAGTATGRKQLLPFVAITDRRLETSKKSGDERQKDFEQNNYPMP